MDEGINQMEAVKSAARELKQVLFIGFFAMLPSLLFAAIPFLVFDWLGIDATKYEIVIFLFGGACGGCWTAKKMILFQIEKMQDHAKKWEIYNQVKSS